MAIEAPISKYKKTNLKIYILACIVFAVIFGYDGYLSKYKWSMRRSFYEKHVNNGKPDDDMLFNRISPFFLLLGAVALGFRHKSIANKKLIADETALVISSTRKIPYESIEKIDKTYFDSKGYFVITYKDKEGKEDCCKISDRTYDNLAAVLDHLVAKIS